MKRLKKPPTLEQEKDIIYYTKKINNIFKNFKPGNIIKYKEKGKKEGSHKIYYFEKQAIVRDTNENAILVSIKKNNRFEFKTINKYDLIDQTIIVLEKN